MGWLLAFLAAVAAWLIAILWVALKDPHHDQ